MILSFGVEIRVQGFPSTIVPIRLAIKWREQQNIHGGGRLEQLEAKTLLEQAIQVYQQERTSDPSLPELPDQEHLALVNGKTEYEATDDVSMKAYQSSMPHDNHYNRLAVVDTRERKPEQIKRVVDETKQMIIAGGIGADDQYVVVELPSTKEKIVCLRSDCGLTQFLRGIIQSDERLFQRQQRQKQRMNSGIGFFVGGGDNVVTGIDAFPIRLRLTEFARHSHKIIGIVSHNVPDESHSPKADKKHEKTNKDEENPDTAMMEAENFLGTKPAPNGGESYHGSDGSVDPGVWARLDKEVQVALLSMAQFLREELQAMHAQWQDIFDDGQVSFESLILFLGSDTQVVTESGDGFLQGGRVTEINFHAGRIGLPDWWEIKVETVVSNGLRFSPTSSTTNIFDFRPKLKSVHELPLRPISNEEKERLMHRGQIYRELAIGAHHKAYLGPMRNVRQNHHDYMPIGSVRADGRIMVDIERFYIQTQGSVPNLGNQGHPQLQYEEDMNHRRGGAGVNTSAFQEKGAGKNLHQEVEGNNVKNKKKKGSGLFDPLDDSLLWMTPPSLPAFSFRHHKFGICHIELMSDIVWREETWDQLVLPEVKKDLIRALVLQTRSQAEVDVLERRRWASTRLMNSTPKDPIQEPTAATTKDDKQSETAKKKDSEWELDDEMDIVRGKGGGCTMLLHGPCGVGKTLTAEAVAELLQRPLYSVTVGELGTTPPELERQLMKVLDLASCWRAIILLDEAEVYLAKRETSIARNGLVSIFLRTIEYFNGVLILTSNLAGTIDEAFASRIHLSLHYKELGVGERAKVWHNFLGRLGEEPFDYEALAAHDLNGRQIRSAVRVARALARDKGKPLSQHMLEQVITQTVA